MASPVVTKIENVISALPMGWIELPRATGKPWHRRGLGTLTRDTWGVLTLPIARFQLWWALRREARRAQRSLPRSVTTRDLYFVDLRYGDRRALDLVRDYLDKLEMVVKTAEDELARDASETGFPHLSRPPKKRCGTGASEGSELTPPICLANREQTNETLRRSAAVHADPDPAEP